jgi:probable addiction module antidote protein
MSTVFIGGSRHISRLSADAKQRLQTIVDKKIGVLVGDANGADKAVQKFMADAAYDQVTVFCSGEHPRNNLGGWKIHSVVPSHPTGFHFYAAKDREMALTADYGFMIWDGKSAGTALNVLRLIRAGKKADLLNVPEKSTLRFRLISDWEKFISRCDWKVVADLRERATPQEWPAPVPTVSSIEPHQTDEGHQTSLSLLASEELTADINTAFLTGDMAAVVNLLGSFAKARGMATVAKQTGLSRESLYRSLSSDGNPEFSTILKVIDSLGLRLSVGKPAANALVKTSHATH